MKLFNQLSSQEQERAINFCISNVLDDMLDGDLEVEPIAEEDEALTQHIIAIIEEAKQIDDKDDQIDYIMGDPDASQIVFDLATNLARSAYYHSNDEFVIFETDLDDEHSCPECGGEVEVVEDKEKMSKDKRNLLN